MTLTPRSTVIWTTRFQLRTADFAGVLVGTRPPQYREHRGDAHAGVRARLAELRDEIVVGAWVIEERDEVAVRCQLQVFVAQICDQAREVEQVVVMVERRGIQCDLHVTLP